MYLILYEFHCFYHKKFAMCVCVYMLMCVSVSVSVYVYVVFFFSLFFLSSSHHFILVITKNVWNINLSIFRELSPIHGIKCFP